MGFWAASLGALSGRRRTQPRILLRLLGNRRLRGCGGGAIQASVLTVLGEAERPLRVRDVHALVEERLEVQISYHTICSFLIAAGKKPASGVERVRHGMYRAAG